MGRIGSSCAVPLAPLFGVALAYRLFHPARRGHHKRPEDAGLTAETLKVPFGRGRHLEAWLCRGAADRVVVLGHGLGLSRSASLAHARLLHDAGYTVCLFDHRNHGGSDGDRACTGLSDRFTADVTAVVTHLRAAGYADARFATYGFSFSTCAVLYALTRPDFQLDAVICDSGPVARISRLFPRLLDAGVIPLPAPFRTGRARSVLSRVLDRSCTAMLGAHWPPHDGSLGRVPVLLLAGGQDPIMPASEVRAFAAGYPHMKVEDLPRAEHLTGLKTEPERYRDTVLAFLDSALGAESRGTHDFSGHSPSRA